MAMGMDGNVRKEFEGFRTGAKGDQYCSCRETVSEEDEFYDFILSFQDGSYQVDHIVCTRGMSNAGHGNAKEAVERQEDEIEHEEEEDDDDDEYWEEMQDNGECNAQFTSQTSISITDDTDCSSFSFPRLDRVWSGSPARMPEAKHPCRRGRRRLKFWCWRPHILCCKF